MGSVSVSAVPLETVRKLDRRVRTMWWVADTLAAVAVTLAALAVDMLFQPMGRPGLLTACIAVASGALAAVLPALRYHRWRYALRPRDLWIQRGTVWVTVSVIPYRRLQFVDTQQGPLDRIFGLADLIVYTAASGTSGRLPGLDAAQAEQLRERLGDIERDAPGV